jgi:uncharacterized membrane protein
MAAPGLAGLLAVAGGAHFLIPGFYDAVVPRVLPGAPRRWVLVSGVAEIIVAIMVAAPRTRRLGAALAGVLFVAVFPANIQMAVDWRRQSTLRSGVAAVRLPLQIPRVWWAIRVNRASPPVDSDDVAG